MELNWLDDHWRISVDDNAEFEEINDALIFSPLAYLRLNASWINSGFPAEVVVSDKQLLKLSDRLLLIAQKGTWAERLGLADYSEESGDVCQRLSDQNYSRMGVL